MERYKLTTQFRRGRQGRTYTAVDVQEGAEVTISFMNEELGDQEIAASAALKVVPNVLQLKDSFTVQSRMGTKKALVYESVKRSYLVSSVMSTLSSTMTEVSVSYILQQLLSTLIEVHAMGIVHCDIRASSLLISTEGELKLTNLRSAVRASTTLRRSTGTPIRRPSYTKTPPASPSSGSLRKTIIMSPQLKHTDPSPWYAPECREGESVSTTPLDIWCVGMTALELSIGVLPQDGQLAGINAFIEGPDSVYGGKAFSSEFKDFIIACLRRDPEDRASAHALLHHPLFSLHSLKPAVGKERGARAPPVLRSASSEAPYTTDGEKDAPGLDFDGYLESLSGANPKANEVVGSKQPPQPLQGASEDVVVKTGSLDSSSHSGTSTVSGSGSATSTQSRSGNPPILMACPKPLLNMVRKRHYIERLSCKMSDFKAARQAPGSKGVGGGSSRTASKVSISYSYDSDILMAQLSETEDEDDVFAMASPIRRTSTSSRTSPSPGLSSDGKARSPPPRSTTPGDIAPPPATPPGMMRLNNPGGSSNSPVLLPVGRLPPFQPSDVGYGVGLKPRVGQSGSSNKLPGMVYIGDDRDVSFAEINYLSLPPDSPVDRINRQGSSGHQSDGSLGSIMHNAGASGAGGNSFTTFGRMSTPVSPLSDLQNPNSSLHLLQMPSTGAGAGVAGEAAGAPSGPEDASASSSISAVSVGHLRVPGFLSTSAFVQGLAPVGVGPGLATFGQLRPTPSREMELSSVGDSQDYPPEGSGEADEEWAMRAAQRTALNMEKTSKAVEASGVAGGTTVLKPPAGKAKGARNVSISSSDDEMGDGTKGARHRGKFKGRQRRELKAEEAAVEENANLKAKARGGGGGTSDSSKRRQAARESKSDADVGASSSATGTGKSGPDSGKRSASSKTLSKLMPFQSVLDVLKEHSSSNSNLPDRLSGIFDDVVRPSLRKIVNSLTEKNRGEAGDAAKSANNEEDDIVFALQKALSEAGRVEGTIVSPDGTASTSSASYPSSSSAGALGEKLKKLLDRSEAQSRPRPGGTGDKADKTDKTDKSEKTITDLMMVLVTTMTALDVISDGNLTKGLLQSLMIKTLERTQTMQEEEKAKEQEQGKEMKKE